MPQKSQGERQDERRLTVVLSDEQRAHVEELSDSAGTRTEAKVLRDGLELLWTLGACGVGRLITLQRENGTSVTIEMPRDYSSLSELHPELNDPGNNVYIKIIM